ncbi:hypothetical protein JB92DRAFT_2834950 [Gautieria morchelliformis]|nr:hypothetical protein JB92DRAFT_2834950 [Gautieria morchelliformis]
MNGTISLSSQFQSNICRWPWSTWSRRFCKPGLRVRRFRVPFDCTQETLFSIHQKKTVSPHPGHETETVDPRIYAQSGTLLAITTPKDLVRVDHRSMQPEQEEETKSKLEQLFQKIPCNYVYLTQVVYDVKTCGWLTGSRTRKAGMSGVTGDNMHCRGFVEAYVVNVKLRLSIHVTWNMHVQSDMYWRL